MNKHAFISGINGFLASHVCRFLLQNDWTVAGTIRQNSDLANLAGIKDKVMLVNVQDISIADLAKIMKNFSPDIVFHIGAFFVAEHTSAQIDILLDSNISFGVHILEAMKIAGVKRIITIGTSWQNFLADNLDYHPVDLYAATKEAFEKILQFYQEAEGFQTLTFRLFDVYGEEDYRKKIINMFSELAETKIPLNMSLGEQMLDLVHVEDVCSALLLGAKLLCSECIPSGSIYGVSSGERTTLKQVAALFEELSGKKLNINWGQRAYRKREVMIPQFNYPTLPGWKAEISLREGIRRIISYNNHKNKS